MKTLLHLLAVLWHWGQPKQQTPRPIYVPVVGGPFCGIEALLECEPPDRAGINWEGRNAVYLYQYQAEKRRLFCVAIAPHLKDVAAELCEGK
jgi:hypothetical protein